MFPRCVDIVTQEQPFWSTYPKVLGHVLVFDIDAIYILIDDRLYSAILRSLEETHCACMWFYISD